MPNLKAIRKRISSVSSTLKITRAMKMVAGAQLNRAQQRIVAMRPYAIKTGRVLAEVTAATVARGTGGDPEHPLLARREEKSVLLLVVTSDRGQCGAFNANINRVADRLWKEHSAAGKKVQLAIIGRKGREFFVRRNAPILEVFTNIWQHLGAEQAGLVARKCVAPFVRGEVDSVYLVYNEFKSAMSQRVVAAPLFPLALPDSAVTENDGAGESTEEFEFEPSQSALLEQLVPTYIEVTILRALYESMASELGARMTAMDSASKNASEIIDKLTLKYNRARQAIITTELTEIISGANALED